MSYTDGKYYARPLIMVGDDRSFGTATASGAAGFTATDIVYLPKFPRRTQINYVRFRCRTAPNTGATGLIVRMLNGTTTHGTAVLTTRTAGEVFDLTVTGGASNSQIFSSESSPTMNLVGTSTASGGTAGAFDIFFEEREMYDSATAT